MLVYKGPKGKSPFFPPDRMENIRHNVQEGKSITVLDRNGNAICGFVHNNPTGKEILIAENWEIV